MPDPPGALTRLSDLSSMAEGVKYRSLDDEINAARIHAQKANFSYRVKDRNKKRAVVKCSGHSCPAYTRISLSKNTSNLLWENLRMAIAAKALSKRRGVLKRITGFLLT